MGDFGFSNAAQKIPQAVEAIETALQRLPQYLTQAANTNGDKLLHVVRGGAQVGTTAVEAAETGAVAIEAGGGLATLLNPVTLGLAATLGLGAFGVYAMTHPVPHDAPGDQPTGGGGAPAPVHPTTPETPAPEVEEKPSEATPPLVVHVASANKEGFASQPPSLHPTAPPQSEQPTVANPQVNTAPNRFPPNPNTPQPVQARPIDDMTPRSQQGEGDAAEAPAATDGETAATETKAKRPNGRYDTTLSMAGRPELVNLHNYMGVEKAAEALQSAKKLAIVVGSTQADGSMHNDGFTGAADLGREMRSQGKQVTYIVQDQQAATALRKTLQAYGEPTDQKQIVVFDPGHESGSGWSRSKKDKSIYDGILAADLFFNKKGGFELDAVVAVDVAAVSGRMAEYYDANGNKVGNSAYGDYLNTQPLYRLVEAATENGRTAVAVSSLPTQVGKWTAGDEWDATGEPVSRVPAEHTVTSWSSSVGAHALAAESRRLNGSGANLPNEWAHEAGQMSVAEAGGTDVRGGIAGHSPGLSLAAIKLIEVQAAKVDGNSGHRFMTPEEMQSTGRTPAPVLINTGSPTAMLPNPPQGRHDAVVYHLDGTDGIFDPAGPLERDAMGYRKDARTRQGSPYDPALVAFNTRNIADLHSNGNIEAAALAIRNSKKVLLLTNFNVEAGMPETDGPPGTAVLGRALQKTGKEVVYCVSDEPARRVLAASLKAVGVDNPEIVIFTPDAGSDGSAAAKAVLDKYKPDAMIATEVPGRTSEDRSVNMRGKDISGFNTALYQIANEANNREGITTVGIFDGGNEVGAGNVADRVPLALDGSSIMASQTKVHVPVEAWNSNFGADTLAIEVLRQHDMLDQVHTGRQLVDAIHAAYDAGAVDGVTRGAVAGRSIEGSGDPSQSGVDGFAPWVHGEMHDLQVQRARERGLPNHIQPVANAGAGGSPLDVAPL